MINIYMRRTAQEVNTKGIVKAGSLNLWHHLNNYQNRDERLGAERLGHGTYIWVLKRRGKDDLN